MLLVTKQISLRIYSNSLLITNILKTKTQKREKIKKKNAWYISTSKLSLLDSSTSRFALLVLKSAFLTSCFWQKVADHNQSSASVLALLNCPWCCKNNSKKLYSQHAYMLITYINNIISINHIWYKMLTKVNYI